MLTHPVTVKPLTTAIGAEILGLDISRPPDEATVALIRQTYNAHGVVFFREQHLDPDQFMAFAKRFGPVTTSKLAAALVDGYSEVQELAKAEGAVENVGGEWHTDQSFRDVPTMGTILCSRKLPDVGGDTLFISLGAAYDALSGGLKETLRGLRAVHSNAYRPQQIRRRAQLGITEPDEAVHPVVGEHPETGRLVLYVNPTYAIRFDGWTAAESAPLLQFLFRHLEKPEFQCRFRWAEGSVAFWDNRQCLHYAVNDYPGGTRVMHRLMVEGPFLK